MQTVPHFQTRRDITHVSRWGRILGCTLRVGDKLVVDEHRKAGLVLLQPKGFGSPMLGRSTARGLRAEPGDVPASRLRWSVAGAVSSVERALERGGPEAGSWWVAVSVCPIPGRQADGEGALDVLGGGFLSTSEVEALLLRATLAPERWGVEVSVGLAHSAGQAEQLAVEAAPGSLRFVLGAAAATEGLPLAGAEIIQGPWRAARPAARPRWLGAGPEQERHEAVQVGLFADSQSA